MNIDTRYYATRAEAVHAEVIAPATELRVMLTPEQVERIATRILEADPRGYRCSLARGLFALRVHEILALDARPANLCPRSWCTNDPEDHDPALPATEHQHASTQDELFPGLSGSLNAHGNNAPTYSTLLDYRPPADYDAAFTAALAELFEESARTLRARAATITAHPEAGTR